MIKPDSVFIVSGGAKGITARCVIELAKYYQCKWILLGRSRLIENEPISIQNCTTESEIKKQIMQDFLDRGEKPTPVKVGNRCKEILSSREIKQTLTTLQELDNYAEYIDLDVADTEAVKTKISAIETRLGTVTGIIHGAGNLADKLIENKTEKDFEKVYAAKVKGLENILNCLDLTQLEHLVLFSSVAGFFGNVGQTDYALANEILNKSAHLAKQYNPSCHVVSINWGPWDSGMVSPQLKKFFQLYNIDLIPVETGGKMLVKELAEREDGSPQIVIGSPIVPTADNYGRGSIIADIPLRKYRICRHLSESANPFLQDHKIGDNAVLPLTCAAAWIATTCAQLYPGYQLFSLENFKVLKGIVFEDNSPKEYFLDIRETAKSNHEIVFEAIAWSKFNNQNIKLSQRIHYSCQVKIKANIPETKKLENINFSQQEVIQGKDVYQNGTLFHGQSFQGIESVLSIDSQKIVLECIAPTVDNKQAGQFLDSVFNPYIVDTFLQGLVVWVRQFYKSASLPLEFDRFTQFKPILPEQKYYVVVEITTDSKTRAIANIIACNDRGNIYASFSGAKVTISPQLNHLFVANNR